PGTPTGRRKATALRELAEPDLGGARSQRQPARRRRADGRRRHATDGRDAVRAAARGLRVGRAEVRLPALAELAFGPHPILPVGEAHARLVDVVDLGD